MNLVWKPKNVGFRWRWFDTVDAKYTIVGFFLVLAVIVGGCVFSYCSVDNSLQICSRSEVHLSSSKSDVLIVCVYSSPGALAYSSWHHMDHMDFIYLRRRSRKNSWYAPWFALICSLRSCSWDTGLQELGGSLETAGTTHTFVRWQSMALWYLALKVEPPFRPYFEEIIASGLIRKWLYILIIHTCSIYMHVSKWMTLIEEDLGEKVDALSGA